MTTTDSTAAFEEQLQNKTPAELEEMATHFGQMGWIDQQEAVEEELSQRDPEATQGPSDEAEEADEEPTVEGLQERKEWFEDQGWDSNAEQVEARIEELEESTEETSEDAVEVKVADLSEDIASLRKAKTEAALALGKEALRSYMRGVSDSMVRERAKYADDQYAIAEAEKRGLDVE